MINWLVGCLVLVGGGIAALLITGAVQLNRTDFRCLNQSTYFSGWTEYREIGPAKLMWPTLAYKCNRQINSKTGEVSEGR